MTHALPIDGREIAVILPGSAWLGILTSHVDWAITTPLECIEEGDRRRIARQLRLLLAAAVDGASPTMDDLLTETRELVDTACEILGHVPDAEDTRLAELLVLRYDVLRSLLKKPMSAAVARALPPEPRTT